MLCNYEKVMMNMVTVREMTKRYRREMTIAAGIVSRDSKVMEFDDYVKVMNELTLDEFCGNYIAVVLSSESLSVYREVLDGKISFCDAWTHWLNEDQIEELKERLNVK